MVGVYDENLIPEREAQKTFRRIEEDIIELDRWLFPENNYLGKYENTGKWNKEIEEIKTKMQEIINLNAKISKELEESFKS
ncbi:MAG: hypothetical protein WCQ96_02885 [Patescibacteria group bacterium]